MLVRTCDIAHTLVCPRCLSGLTVMATGVVCTDPDCVYRREPFPVIDGQPALIDFESSIVDRCALVRSAGAPTIRRDPMHRTLTLKVRRFFLGENQGAKKIGAIFLRDVLARAERPSVLIIGGGDASSGSRPILEDKNVRVVATDIYASPNLTLLADGHSLPFKDASFDGVWIQAVLEHVLDPWRVVAEIHRVLKPKGLVYADTPFMQPVHEEAYDFMRFSLSGHRWLFRNFETIQAGVSNGAGAALNLSARYFVRGLAHNNKVGTLAALALFWLRFFDRFATSRWTADMASGTFFYGRRSDKPITPKQIVAFYADQKRIHASAFESAN